MQIVIKQNFYGSPLDGQTLHRCYGQDDIEFATDARPPCVFDADGTPKWCAWYVSDDDVILGGVVAGLATGAATGPDRFHHGKIRTRVAGWPPAHLKKLDNQRFTNNLEGSLLCFSNDNGNTWRFLDGNDDAFANIRQQHPKLAAKITCPQQLHIIDEKASIKVDGEWIPDEKETRRARRALLKFDHVPELEKLRAEIKRSEVGKVLGVDLDGTKITDVGLLHLAGMTNLEFVGLTKTFVTDAGVAKLMKALPKCGIF